MYPHYSQTALFKRNNYESAITEVMGKHFLATKINLTTRSFRKKIRENGELKKILEHSRKFFELTWLAFIMSKRWKSSRVVLSCPMQNKPATSNNDFLPCNPEIIFSYFLLPTWILFHFSSIFLYWSLQLPSSRPHSTTPSLGKHYYFSLWIPALAKFYLTWIPGSLSQLWRHHITLVTASAFLLFPLLLSLLPHTHVVLCKWHS